MNKVLYMDMTYRTDCTSPSATTGLLLEAMGVCGRYDRIRINGLPEHAILVPERETIIAVTTARPPLFAERLEAIAAEHRLDVVLLRLDAPDSVITADFALGSLPCAVWAERGFALYHDAHSTWLVPKTFGPAVSITLDGCMLEIVPPYSSLDERSAGITRAARDLARLLMPVKA